MWESGVERDSGKPSQVMEMFCVILLLCVFAKAHQILHLTLLNFITYKLYLTKTSFKKYDMIFKSMIKFISKERGVLSVY